MCFFANVGRRFLNSNNVGCHFLPEFSWILPRFSGFFPGFSTNKNFGGALAPPLPLPLVACLLRNWRHHPGGHERQLAIEAFLRFFYSTTRKTIKVALVQSDDFRTRPKRWKPKWSVCDPVVFANLQCGLEPKNLDGTNLGSSWCLQCARQFGQRGCSLPYAWKSLICVVCLVFPFSLLWSTLLRRSGRASVTATQALSYWVSVVLVTYILKSWACFFP